MRKFTAIIVICISALAVGIIIYIDSTIFLHKEAAYALVYSFHSAFYMFSLLPVVLIKDIGPDALNKRILTGYIAMPYVGAAILYCLLRFQLQKDMSFVISCIIEYMIFISALISLVMFLSFLYILIKKRKASLNIHATERRLKT
jgi:hypothetical protein